MSGTLSRRSERTERRRFSLPDRLRTPRALVIGFVVLHLAFLAALIPVIVAGQAEGDLPLYRQWASEAVFGGVWPGIDVNWVYPVGALLPVVLPMLFGAAAYQLTWFLLLTVANAISLWVLTDGGRRRSAYPAAWWWLGMLLILSPVALLRLESFTSPLVIVALVLLAARPRLATVLLTVATWIKVWPAAVIGAAVIASARRRVVALVAAVTSAVIVAITVAAGGLWHVTSFLGMQDGRHLQLESTLATPWLWMAITGVPGARVYQDWTLETREVTGPGDTWMVDNATLIMLAALAVVCALIAWARWRTAASRDGGLRLVFTGALSLATAFVVFNKVGSPQYMLWLAPIVVVGIAAYGRRWRAPAILLTAIGTATTLVFPIFYLALIDLNPVVAAVLGARNALLVVLFAWTLRELWRIGRDAETLRSALPAGLDVDLSAPVSAASTR